MRAAIAAAPVPASIEMAAINDDSSMIANRLDLMFTNGLIGVVLVTVVLFLLSGPARRSGYWWAFPWCSWRP